MACDRPLQKLDADTGPYIPAHYMPQHAAADHLSSHGLPAKDRDPVSRGSPRKPGQLAPEASSKSLVSGMGPAATALPQFNGCTYSGFAGAK